MGTCVARPLPVGGPLGGLLHVVLVHFNPAGYQRREAHFKTTLAHILENHPSARVVTMEVVMPDAGPSLLARLRQDPWLSEAAKLRWVESQTFTSDCVWWAKEWLVNAGVKVCIGRGATAVAWIDADIHCADRDWVPKTLSALKSHHVVQMFSHATLDGPRSASGDQVCTTTVQSFAYQYVRGKKYVSRRNTDGDYWHPGFAWAARTDSWVNLPECTLGSADLYVARALIGEPPLDEPLASTLSPAYTRYLAHFADFLVGLRLGVVLCSINHRWHGDFESRQYFKRNEVLVRSKFSPDFLTRVPGGGVLKWTELASAEFLKDVEGYFFNRNEDEPEAAAAERLMGAGRHAKVPANRGHNRGHHHHGGHSHDHGDHHEHEQQDGGGPFSGYGC